MKGTNTNTRRRKILKSNKNKTRKTYSKKDYNSGDGFLVSIWGPPVWLFLHSMSFNYPVHPTEEDKLHYMNFVLYLQYVLPCKYCRINLVNNLKKRPLTLEDMKNRETFSRYIYELHEQVNTLLNKKSQLSYDDVRDRFENFRARCASTNKEKNKDNKDKHKGCITPLQGRTKSKCILKIVPFDEVCETLEINEKCIKK